MNSSSISHKHLRYTSWIVVAIAFLGLPAAYFYFVASISSCWDLLNASLGCKSAILAPRFLIILPLIAYLFVLKIIHDLGREKILESTNLPPSRYAWRHAKLGYKNLQKGHHHHVRRVHRMSAIALAGLAAYCSFQFFEADTIVNLTIAIIIYVFIGELLNWKKYSKLIESK